jgi:hypothetical protein
VTEPPSSDGEQIASTTPTVYPLAIDAGTEAGEVTLDAPVSPFE